MNSTTAGRKVWIWAAVRASTAGMVVELAFASAALFLWGLAHPGPEGDSGALAVFFLPVWLVIATAVSLLLTLTLVMPTASLAFRAGRRFGGDDAWWWVPAAAGAVSAAVVTAVGLCAGLLGGHVGAPPVYAWWWLAIAVLVAPAGLLARLSAHRAAQGRPAGLVRTVLLNGCGGVVAFFVVVLVVAIVAESAVG
ncbi:hypothetical protein [Streptomyces sp. NPDC053048]|uniref:hypothetical protein n=1 Tax=Streptomyces sp. NPDC053048 TaxID=3365694 RepID=UPI0037D8985D